jgi:hypothetical protein
MQKFKSEVIELDNDIKQIVVKQDYSKNEDLLRDVEIN